jgi:hypothetical protein
VDAPSTIPVTVIPITAATITPTRFTQQRRCMDMVPLRSIQHHRSMSHPRYSGLTIVRAGLIAGTTVGMAGTTGVVTSTGAMVGSVQMCDLERLAWVVGTGPEHGKDAAKTCRLKKGSGHRYRSQFAAFPLLAVNPSPSRHPALHPVVPACVRTLPRCITASSRMGSRTSSPTSHTVAF